MQHRHVERHVPLIASLLQHLACSGDTPTVDADPCAVAATTELDHPKRAQRVFDELFGALLAGVHTSYDTDDYEFSIPWRDHHVDVVECVALCIICGTVVFDKIEIGQGNLLFGVRNTVVERIGMKKMCYPVKVTPCLSTEASVSVVTP